MKCNILICSKIVALAASVIVFALVAGCGGGGGGGGGVATPIADITSPVVTGQKATPDSFDFDPIVDAEVTLEAVVTDNVGLKEVQAVISLGGVTLENKTMQLISGNTYRTKYIADTNLTAVNQVYKANVRATDTSENVANSAEFTFVLKPAGGGLPDPDL